MKKQRPCVIVQRDAATHNSPITIVCPLTDANGDRGNLLNIFVAQSEGGTSKESLIVCNQVRSIDKTRLGNHLGTLSTDTMDKVDRGLRAILNLG